MSAAKIIGIAVKTATIRELAHERPDHLLHESLVLKEQMVS